MSESASGEADDSTNASVKEVSTKTLRELYVEQGLSQYQIAKRFCENADKVRTQLLSRGVLRPGQIQVSKEKLEKYYHSHGLSQREVANELDMSKTAVYRHINHYGLEKKPHEWQSDRFDAPVSMSTNKRGYETISIPEGGGEFGVHRLVAIAEHGIDDVSEAEVHHKNGIPWDNRPENLEPLSKSEHSEKSANQMIISQLSKASDETVKDILKSAGYSDIAEQL